MITLRKLKEFVNSLSEESLDKNLTYISEDFYYSGKVLDITNATEDLYWLGDDDPSILYTEDQLIDDLGMLKEEIDESMIEIYKGESIIKI